MKNWHEEFEKQIICHCEETCEDSLAGKHTISNPEKILAFISLTLTEAFKEVEEGLIELNEPGLLCITEKYFKEIKEKFL